jgi:spore germination cell wall hydrolase CwlJ-like protein
MKVILQALIAFSLSLNFNFVHAEVPVPLSPILDLTKFQEKELYCLARNIYHEAGGESFEGQVAVAMVSINRMESGKFPDTICGVVHQKTHVSPQRVVCQFSWVCQGKRLQVSMSKRWEDAMTTARMVLLDGYRISKLEDAMYFHAIYVNPNWGKPKVARIGNHIFYRDHKPK